MQESVIIFGCSVLIFLYILFYDLKYYKIPNWCSGSIFILGFMYILVNDKQLHVVFYYLIISFSVLAVGFYLFAKKIWGAGDAKLMAAAVFFIDIPQILYFLSASFIFGVIWAIFLWHFKNQMHPILDFSEFRKAKIPFAPGIISSLIFVKNLS
jgi:Flp pilus assembly protein protease CpaA